MHEHMVIVLASCLILVGVAVSSTATGPGAGMPDVGEHRGDVLEKLSGVAEDFEADPEMPGTRLAFAKVLYETGDFAAAYGVLEPLLEADDPSTEAMLVAARIHYLHGDYEEAERWLSSVLEREPDNVSALNKLVLIYFQTGRYGLCADIPEESRALVRLPHLELMMAFGGTRPYEADWHGANHTEVPFLITDPLPMIDVEVEGMKLTSLIDTGANAFVLDAEVAASLGVEIVAELMGMFAGGMEAKVGLAIVDSLSLGGVTLHAVPVAVLPTRQLSLGEYTIDGIVGTNLLRQFLSTVDYPNDRLILRDPAGAAASDFYEESEGQIVQELPFFLESTHFMMAPGSLNGQDGLLFHVDSGLAGEASFGAFEQTLDYLDIPVPDLETEGAEVQGGGGTLRSATFPVAELGLGGLSQADLLGAFGAAPPQGYRMLGFINDGTISHGFLRKYSWTIDFSRMTMVFTR